MLISELAKRTGVTIYTLRYYENYGLFKGEPDSAVKTNNYKQYDEHLIEKIQLIKEAKEIGFTLSEIKLCLHRYSKKSSLLEFMSSESQYETTYSPPTRFQLHCAGHYQCCPAM
jgi:DNA-binding transcriptional MerR regulator